jgi:hypothetical protein
LNKIANFNVIRTDKFNSNLMKFQDKELTKVYRFRIYDYWTSSFILNSEILFWIFQLWICLAILMILSKFIFLRIPYVNKVYRAIYKKMFFTIIIRFTLESYFELLLCSIVNLN